MFSAWSLIITWIHESIRVVRCRAVQATPEGCFDSAIYPGVYLDPIRVDGDGYVHAPTKPGPGFGIDLKEAEKVTVQTL